MKSLNILGAAALIILMSNLVTAKAEAAEFTVEGVVSDSAVNFDCSTIKPTNNDKDYAMRDAQKKAVTLCNSDLQLVSVSYTLDYCNPRPNDFYTDVTFTAHAKYQCGN
jgi:hypothetical protein